GPVPDEVGLGEAVPGPALLAASCERRSSAWSAPYAWVEVGTLTPSERVAISVTLDDARVTQSGSWLAGTSITLGLPTAATVMSRAMSRVPSAALTAALLLLPPTA